VLVVLLFIAVVAFFFVVVLVGLDLAFGFATKLGITMCIQKTASSCLYVCGVVVKGKPIRCQKSCETFAGICGISWARIPLYTK